MRLLSDFYLHQHPLLSSHYMGKRHKTCMHTLDELRGVFMSFHFSGFRMSYRFVSNFTCLHTNKESQSIM